MIRSANCFVGISYSLAFSHTKRISEVAPQYTLAKCFLYGWGCKQDKDAAKRVLRKLGDYRGADKLLKQL